MDQNTVATLFFGLAINIAATLFGVFRSRLMLEKRLTKVETLVEILVRNSGAHVRRSDLDEDNV